MRDAHGRRAADIVLDKTGAIFIDDYDAARAYFARIDALMRPGALYVYIASRHYYGAATRRTTPVGPDDLWLALAASTWGVLVRRKTMPVRRSAATTSASFAEARGRRRLAARAARADAAGVPD